MVEKDKLCDASSGRCTARCLFRSKKREYMLTSGHANKPIVDCLAVIPWVRWYNTCHSGRLKKKSRYVMSDGPRKFHALVLLLVFTSGK